jgi:hypothetical protein
MSEVKGFHRTITFIVVTSHNVGERRSPRWANTMRRRVNERSNPDDATKRRAIARSPNKLTRIREAGTGARWSRMSLRRFALGTRNFDSLRNGSSAAELAARSYTEMIVIDQKI